MECLIEKFRSWDKVMLYTMLPEMICTFAEGRGMRVCVCVRARLCVCVCTCVRARYWHCGWKLSLSVHMCVSLKMSALSERRLLQRLSGEITLPHRAVCSNTDLHVWTAINGKQRHCHFQWHCTRCRNTTSSLSIRPYLISSCFRRSLSAPDSPPKIYESALSAFRDIIQRLYHSALYSGPRDCLNN